MVGFDFGNIPMMKDVVAISKKAVTALEHILSNTDALQRFNETGVMPIQIVVYDYTLTLVLEDRRKTSIPVDVTIPGGDEDV